MISFVIPLINICFGEFETSTSVSLSGRSCFGDFLIHLDIVPRAWFVRQRLYRKGNSCFLSFIPITFFNVMFAPQALVSP